MSQRSCAGRWRADIPPTAIFAAICAQLFACRVVVAAPCHTHSTMSPRGLAAAPQPKRRRLVRKESVPEPEEKATGPAQLETLATMVRKHHHATQMRKGWGAMMKDSELTANLHYMVETGKFARSVAAGAEGMLPQSCNKFSMMRADRKEALLRQLLGKKLPSSDVLKNIRKKQKNFFDALLCSLLNIEITCAVFTKDLAELTRICKDRAKEVKSPMLKVANMSSGIDWQAYGVYQWVKNERGAIVKLKHVQSTEEVDLSDFGHQVDDTWKFDRTWDT